MATYTPTQQFQMLTSQYLDIYKKISLLTSSSQTEYNELGALISSLQCEQSLKFEAFIYFLQLVDIYDPNLVKVLISQSSVAPTPLPLPHRSAPKIELLRRLITHCNIDWFRVVQYAFLPQQQVIPDPRIRYTPSITTFPDNFFVILFKLFAFPPNFQLRSILAILNPNQHNPANIHWLKEGFLFLQYFCHPEHLGHLNQHQIQSTQTFQQQQQALLHRQGDNSNANNPQNQLQQPPQIMYDGHWHHLLEVISKHPPSLIRQKTKIRYFHVISHYYPSVRIGLNPAIIENLKHQPSEHFTLPWVFQNYPYIPHQHQFFAQTQQIPGQHAQVLPRRLVDVVLEQGASTNLDTYEKIYNALESFTSRVQQQTYSQQLATAQQNNTAPPQQPPQITLTESDFAPLFAIIFRTQHTLQVAQTLQQRAHADNQTQSAQQQAQQQLNNCFSFDHHVWKYFGGEGVNYKPWNIQLWIRVINTHYTINWGLLFRLLDQHDTFIADASALETIFDVWSFALNTLPQHSVQLHHQLQLSADRFPLEFFLGYWRYPTGQLSIIRALQALGGAHPMVNWAKVPGTRMTQPLDDFPYQKFTTPQSSTSTSTAATSTNTNNNNNNANANIPAGSGANATAANSTIPSFAQNPVAQAILAPLSPVEQHVRLFGMYYNQEALQTVISLCEVDVDTRIEMGTYHLSNVTQRQSLLWPLLIHPLSQCPEVILTSLLGARLARFAAIHPDGLIPAGTVMPAAQDDKQQETLLTPFATTVYSDLIDLLISSYLAHTITPQIAASSSSGTSTTTTPAGLTTTTSTPTPAQPGTTSNAASTQVFNSAMLPLHCTSAQLSIIYNRINRDAPHDLAVALHQLYDRNRAFLPRLLEIVHEIKDNANLRHHFTNSPVESLAIDFVILASRRQYLPLDSWLKQRLEQDLERHQTYLMQQQQLLAQNNTMGAQNFPQPQYFFMAIIRYLDEHMAMLSTLWQSTSAATTTTPFVPSSLANTTGSGSTTTSNTPSASGTSANSLQSATQNVFQALNFLPLGLYHHRSQYNPLSFDIIASIYKTLLSTLLNHPQGIEATFQSLFQRAPPRVKTQVLIALDKEILLDIILQSRKFEDRLNIIEDILSTFAQFDDSTLAQQIVLQQGTAHMYDAHTNALVQLRDNKHFQHHGVINNINENGVKIDPTMSAQLHSAQMRAPQTSLHYSIQSPFYSHQDQLIDTLIVALQSIEMYPKAQRDNLTAFYTYFIRRLVKLIYGNTIQTNNTTVATQNTSQTAPGSNSNPPNPVYQITPNPGYILGRLLALLIDGLESPVESHSTSALEVIQSLKAVFDFAQNVNTTTGLLTNATTAPPQSTTQPPPPITATSTTIVLLSSWIGLTKRLCVSPAMAQKYRQLTESIDAVADNVVLNNVSSQMYNSILTVFKPNEEKQLDLGMSIAMCKGISFQLTQAQKISGLKARKEQLHQLIYQHTVFPAPAVTPAGGKSKGQQQQQQQQQQQPAQHNILTTPFPVDGSPEQQQEFIYRIFYQISTQVQLSSLRSSPLPLPGALRDSVLENAEKEEKLALQPYIALLSSLDVQHHVTIAHAVYDLALTPQNTPGHTQNANPVIPALSASNAVETNAKLLFTEITKSESPKLKLFALVLTQLDQDMIEEEVLDLILSRFHYVAEELLHITISAPHVQHIASPQQIDLFSTLTYLARLGLTLGIFYLQRNKLLPHHLFDIKQCIFNYYDRRNIIPLLFFLNRFISSSNESFVYAVPSPYIVTLLSLLITTKQQYTKQIEILRASAPQQPPNDPGFNAQNNTIEYYTASNALIDDIFTSVSQSNQLSFYKQLLPPGSVLAATTDPSTHGIVFTPILFDTTQRPPNTRIFFEGLSPLPYSLIRPALVKHITDMLQLRQHHVMFQHTQHYTLHHGIVAPTPQQPNAASLPPSAQLIPQDQTALQNLQPLLQLSLHLLHYPATELLFYYPDHRRFISTCLEVVMLELLQHAYQIIIERTQYYYQQHYGAHRALQQHTTGHQLQQPQRTLVLDRLDVYTICSSLITDTMLAHRFFLHAKQLIIVEPNKPHDGASPSPGAAKDPQDEARVQAEQKAYVPLHIIDHLARNVAANNIALLQRRCFSILLRYAMLVGQKHSIWMFAHPQVQNTNPATCGISTTQMLAHIHNAQRNTTKNTGVEPLQITVSPNHIIQPPSNKGMQSPLGQNTPNTLSQPTKPLSMKDALLQYTDQRTRQQLELLNSVLVPITTPPAVGVCTEQHFHLQMQQFQSIFQRFSHHIAMDLVFRYIIFHFIETIVNMDFQPLIQWNVDRQNHALKIAQGVIDAPEPLLPPPHLFYPLDIVRVLFQYFLKTPQAHQMQQVWVASQLQQQQNGQPFFDPNTPTHFTFTEFFTRLFYTFYHVVIPDRTEAMHTVISYFLHTKFVTPQQLDDTLMAHITYSQNNPMSERFDIFILELNCLAAFSPIPVPIIAANEKLYVALSGQSVEQSPQHPQYQDLLLKNRPPLLIISQLIRTFEQIKVLIEQLQTSIQNPSTLPSLQQLPPQLQNQHPLDRCKYILSQLQSALDINQQIASGSIAQPSPLNTQLYTPQKMSARQFAQFKKGQLAFTTENHLIAVASTGPIPSSNPNPSTVLPVPTKANVALFTSQELQHRTDNAYGVGVMIPQHLLTRMHVESPLTDGFVLPSCKPITPTNPATKIPPAVLSPGRPIQSMLLHHAELRSKYELRDARLHSIDTSIGLSPFELLLNQNAAPIHFAAQFPYIMAHFGFPTPSPENTPALAIKVSQPVLTNFLTTTNAIIATSQTQQPTYNAQTTLQNTIAQRQVMIAENVTAQSLHSVPTLQQISTIFTHWYNIYLNPQATDMQYSLFFAQVLLPPHSNILSSVYHYYYFCMASLFMVTLLVAQHPKFSQMVYNSTNHKTSSNISAVAPPPSFGVILQQPQDASGSSPSTNPPGQSTTTSSVVNNMFNHILPTHLLSLVKSSTINITHLYNGYIALILLICQHPSTPIRNFASLAAFQSPNPPAINFMTGIGDDLYTNTGFVPSHVKSVLGEPSTMFTLDESYQVRVKLLRIWSFCLVEHIRIASTVTNSSQYAYNTLYSYHHHHPPAQSSNSSRSRHDRTASNASTVAAGSNFVNDLTPTFYPPLYGTFLTTLLSALHLPNIPTLNHIIAPELAQNQQPKTTARVSLFDLSNPDILLVIYDSVSLVSPTKYPLFFTSLIDIISHTAFIHRMASPSYSAVLWYYLSSLLTSTATYIKPLLTQFMPQYQPNNPESPLPPAIPTDSKLTKSQRQIYTALHRFFSMVATDYPYGLADFCAPYINEATFPSCAPQFLNTLFSVYPPAIPTSFNLIANPPAANYAKMFPLSTPILSFPLDQFPDTAHLKEWFGRASQRYFTTVYTPLWAYYTAVDGVINQQHKTTPFPQFPQNLLQALIAPNPDKSLQPDPESTTSPLINHNSLFDHDATFVFVLYIIFFCLPSFGQSIKLPSAQVQAQSQLHKDQPAGNSLIMHHLVAPLASTEILIKFFENLPPHLRLEILNLLLNLLQAPSAACLYVSAFIAHLFRRALYGYFLTQPKEDGSLPEQSQSELTARQAHGLYTTVELILYAFVNRLSPLIHNPQTTIPWGIAYTFYNIAAVDDCTKFIGTNKSVLERFNKIKECL